MSARRRIPASGSDHIDGPFIPGCPSSSPSDLRRQVRGYRKDLKYPILFGVAAILEGKLSPREGLERLMAMPLRVEDFLVL